MESNVDRVIDYYDVCHRDYRLAWKTEESLSIHYGYHDETARNFKTAAVNSNRMLAKTLGVTSSDLVIDAGCGVGGTSIWLAENVGCRVLAVNVQPMHVDIGRKEVAARGLEDKIQFLVNDFTNISAETASIDAMFAVEALSHGSDKEAFFHEAARLLKPGGKLVLFEYFTKEAPLTPREEQRLEKFKTGWAMPTLPRLSTYREFAARAGFASVDWTDATDNILPDARRMMMLSALVLPRTYYRVWKGSYHPTVMANRVSGWLQHGLFRQRILSYGILVATR